MSQPDAPGRIRLLAFRWASVGLGLTMSLLFSGSCAKSCQKIESKPPFLDDQISQEPVPNEPEFSSLLFDGCANPNLDEKPILYAHFLKNSVSEGLYLKDLADHEASSFVCAPGPFLAEHQVDHEKTNWPLDRMPNYFVWPLGNLNSDREQFYLTNQTGLPVKSTTVTMGSGKNRAVVLHPQISWNKAEKYFIYQVLIKGQERTTWVQPLIPKAADLN